MEPSDEGSNDPLRRLIEQEEREGIISSLILILILCRQGMDAASPLERTVLKLHELNGITYRGVAEQLDIPLRRVPSLVRRSRRRVARYVRTRLGLKPGAVRA